MVHNLTKYYAYLMFDPDLRSILLIVYSHDLIELYLLFIRDSSDLRQIKKKLQVQLRERRRMPLKKQEVMRAKTKRKKATSLRLARADDSGLGRERRLLVVLQIPPLLKDILRRRTKQV